MSAKKVKNLLPGNTVAISKKEERPPLNPAWFYINSEGNVDIVDSLSEFFNEIEAMGDLISSVNLDMNEITSTTLRRFGWMLINKAKEGSALLDRMDMKNMGRDAV